MASELEQSRLEHPGFGHVVVMPQHGVQKDSLPVVKGPVPRGRKVRRAKILMGAVQSCPDCRQSQTF